MAHRFRSLLMGSALVLLIASGAHAADWKDAQKAFQKEWSIGKVDDPRSKLDKLRGKKRLAARALAEQPDARAVPLLLTAHKKQLKFIEKMRDFYEERLAKWKKLQPAMEKALAKRKPNAEGKILVTPSEDAWMKEKTRLDTYWADTLREVEIAEYTRKKTAVILNGLEGKDRQKALAPILKAAGKGEKPEQLEFVRLLGYIAGDDVTDKLEGYASSFSPFVAQAGLVALGRQNAERSIDTLVARLDDPRWQFRAAALKGLSFFRNARVVETLLERVAQEDGVMQRHYFAALNRIVFNPDAAAEAEAKAKTEEKETPKEGAPLEPGAKLDSEKAEETSPWEGPIVAKVGPWRDWWKKHKQDVIDAWSRGESGPVHEDRPVAMMRSEAAGHTSFYGIQTDSKHILFVLDVSGSMGEQGGTDDKGRLRIDVAKQELKNAIRSLSAEESDARGVSSFNIVIYAADVAVFKEGKMIPATKKNKEKAFEWIDERQATGATNIFDALEKAFGIIGTRKAKKQFEEGADTIFLMTDGQPNRGRIVDPDLIRQEIAKLNRTRQITIHTIGVGEGHAEDFLKGLARENHGEYIARGKPPKKDKDDPNRARR